MLPLHAILLSVVGLHGAVHPVMQSCVRPLTLSEHMQHFTSLVLTERLLFEFLSSHQSKLIVLLTSDLSVSQSRVTIAHSSAQTFLAPKWNDQMQSEGLILMSDYQHVL